MIFYGAEYLFGAAKGNFMMEGGEVEKIYNIIYI